ncbi:hypothetical protein [Nonomuraea salmonea]|uniref:hypothetical protein n=1 Tax=Nonomuraea salmonea TaxID=46181 RepID=UPI002FE79323
MISGLYEGQDGDSRLALRVDVDGPRPTGRVSGDLFTVAGATISYAGSFVVHAPDVRDGLIHGRGDFTFDVPDRDVRVELADGAGSAVVAGRAYPVVFASPTSAACCSNRTPWSGPCRSRRTGPARCRGRPLRPTGS